jgi:hypothetical protein
MQDQVCAYIEMNCYVDIHCRLYVYTHIKYCQCYSLHLYSLFALRSGKVVACMLLLLLRCKHFACLKKCIVNNCAKMKSNVLIWSLIYTMLLLFNGYVYYRRVC